LNQTSIASLHSHIRISHSVILQTQLCITDTVVSGVDNLVIAHFIASSDQLVSAFTTIFNCFKFHALILNISISNHVAFILSFLFKISLYSIAFSLATTEEDTACIISQPQATQVNQTIKTGSHIVAIFIFFQV